MVSFPKHLGRPSLQLLVLALVLEALSKNSKVHAVKCWVLNEECKGSFDCLKKPTDVAAVIKECTTDYCTQVIFNSQNETEIGVMRDCAKPHLPKCFENVTGNCAKLDLTGDDVLDVATYEKSEFVNCSNGQDNGRSAPESGRGPGIMETCLCDKDLCNGGEILTTPQSGASQLAYYNVYVALMGALLVTVFLLLPSALIG